MALPTEIGASARVLSFPASKEAAADDDHRAIFDRLNARAEASRCFINALNRLSTYAGSGRSEADVMEAVDQALSCAIDALRASDGALLVKDDASEDLIFALVQGKQSKEKLLWRRVPAGRGVAHWSVRHRRPTIVNNTMSDERFYSGIDAIHGFRTQSIIAAPLLDGDEAFAVIEIINKKDGEYFSFSDQNHLTILAHLASVLLIELRDRQI